MLEETQRLNALDELDEDDSDGESEVSEFWILIFERKNQKKKRFLKQSDIEWNHSFTFIPI